MLRNQWVLKSFGIHVWEASECQMVSLKSDAASNMIQPTKGCVSQPDGSPTFKQPCKISGPCVDLLIPKKISSLLRISQKLPHRMCLQVWSTAMPNLMAETKQLLPCILKMGCFPWTVSPWSFMILWSTLMQSLWSIDPLVSTWFLSNLLPGTSKNIHANAPTWSRLLTRNSRQRWGKLIDYTLTRRSTANFKIPKKCAPDRPGISCSIYIYIYIYVNIYIYIFVNIYIYICKYINVYIYIYTYFQYQETY